MGRALISILCMGIFLSGCTHALEIKNRKDFMVVAPTEVNREMTLGVSTDNNADNGKRLIDATVEVLRYRIKAVSYPYAGANDKTDLLVTMQVMPNHKGSGLNFLINWPGFLIWTPAWNGYIYAPTYDIRVTVKDPAQGTQLDAFDIPVQLDVRHADFNRTWTEISWFEVSLIAFVGGIVFTDYDPKVTPLVEQEMRLELGAYLADKVLQHITRLQPQPPST